VHAQGKWPLPPETRTTMVNLILIPLIGIGISCVGYGPLSMKRNPAAGVCFAIVGFLFRLFGPLLIVWGLFFWLFVFSMAFGGR
jgi:hypothetical protein